MQRQCSRTNEQLTSNGPVLNRGEVYEPHGEEEFRGGGGFSKTKRSQLVR